MKYVRDANIFNKQHLKENLDVLNGGKSNNMQHELIAEVAVVNGYAWTTSDFRLADTVREHGARTLYFNA